MEYRFTEDEDCVIRLDPGDEVLQCIAQIARENGIRAGSFRGLGASKDFDTAVYDLDEKKYYRSHCGVQSEITSLFGTISVKEGEPYLHAHMQAMTKEGKAVGGHLVRCVINATGEIVLHAQRASLHRKADPRTGLVVLDF